jgi:hypothetical protein
MRPVAGIGGLVRGVRSYFENVELTKVSVYLSFGRERDRIDNLSDSGRIVFIPGEFDPGESSPKPRRAGRLDREGQQNVQIALPGGATQIVRALGWWHYAFTVCVYAIDVDSPNDEAMQVEATEALFERTQAAIHNSVDPATQTPAGFGNIELDGEPSWVVPPGENAFGRELVCGYSMIVPLFEVPPGIAFPTPVVDRQES